MPNTRISDLTAAVSVAGTDVFPSVQTAGVGPVKTSLTQITNFALANAAAGAVGAPSIAPTGDTNTGFWFPAADTIAASTAGSERLRINSSGQLLIGAPNTATAGYGIQVFGGAISISNLAGPSFATPMCAVGAFNNDGVTGGLTFSTSSAGVMGERMRITSAGNVGIGSTNPTQALFIERAGALALQLTNTANSLNLLLGTNTTEAYVSAPNGALAFLAAGSERMRITSAGNVGIGTQSPTAKLDITVATGYAIKFAQASTFAYIAANNETGSANVDLNIYSNNQLFSPGGTEKMRITSAGNVGIGTQSPSDRFVVENTSANVVARISAGGSASYTASLGIGTSARDWSIRADGSSTSYLFSINYTGTDAPLSNILNVTKAGNVGIGTTTISGRLTVDTALTGTPGLLVNSSVAASYASTLFYGTTTTAAGAGFDMIGVYANTVAQFRVRGDGTIYAQNTTVQAISDVRLKDNIRSALDGLSTIMSLRPVRFDWKEGYGNGRKNQLGFVAQEVETVFPDAVDEMKISNASDEAFKTVGPSAFIPVLVKAIQELAAELNELKGKVNA